MSRHYMVCPQNEEMLHKIPPRVRDAIRAEAIADCIAAVEALYGPVPGAYVHGDKVLAALRALDPERAVVEHLADLEIDRARGER